ncbi:putative uncharacterized protein encoded by LINC00269, partial [Nycticebus coucang]|uniref:putative uncharacterized protein encoded by LINC00269 n=1 Tax=Nycticebus coucang TaxID=9470 RepID=UPI00234D18B3
LQLLGSSDSPASASQVFLVEMDFHCVVKADLELLALSDPLALQSQSSGLTGASHHAKPKYPFKVPKIKPVESYPLGPTELKGY